MSEMNCRLTVGVHAVDLDCLRRSTTGTATAAIESALVCVPKVRGLSPSTRDAVTAPHGSDDTRSAPEHQSSATGSAVAAHSHTEHSLSELAKRNNI